MWPFDQPRNCEVILSRAVLDGRTKILFVLHDDDDHSWQFLDDQTLEPEQAALVSLSEVVVLDPSVLEVAGLEPGWVATRKEVGGIWTRERAEPVDDV